MQAVSLQGGFRDAPQDAAHGFRALMQAMARPGSILSLAGATPPAPLSVAAGTLLLTLVDADAPLFLAGGADCAPVRDWIAFHTGAPIVPPQQACFAYGTWEDLQPIERFDIGTSEYPDRAATLIVERPALDARGAVLSGPGIKDTALFDLPDPSVFAANHAQYPRGLDFFFTAQAQVAALPRSTRVG